MNLKSFYFFAACKMWLAERHFRRFKMKPKRSSKLRAGTPEHTRATRNRRRASAVPVTSSRISTSPVFLSRRTRAGIPPQFFSATLFSSLALPYTRFLRAPQALRCTSLIRWSSRSTSRGMPPCLRICRRFCHELTNRGGRGGVGGNFHFSESKNVRR